MAETTPAPERIRTRIVGDQAYPRRSIVGPEVGEAMRAVLDQEPEFALHVARMVTHDLRRAIVCCAQMALQSPLERLASYLLDNADGGGTASGSLAVTSSTITGTLITSIRLPKQLAKKSPTGTFTSGFSRPSQ